MDDGVGFLVSGCVGSFEGIRKEIRKATIEIRLRFNI